MNINASIGEVKMLKKHRLLFSSLLVAVAFVLILPVTLFISTASAINGYILNVDITSPLEEIYIGYCSEFIVSAHFNAPDEIVDNVTGRIEIIGNAKLVSEEITQGVGSLG